ncbi:MAG: hypothetical protein AB1461_20045 [Thermodesulfobacteriota bacterium]
MAEWNNAPSNAGRPGMEWKPVIILVLGGLLAACAYWLVVPSSDLRMEKTISQNNIQAQLVAETPSDVQKNTQGTAQPGERRADRSVTDNRSPAVTQMNTAKPRRFTEAADLTKAPASGKGKAMPGGLRENEMPPINESKTTKQDMEIAWQDVAELDKIISELYHELHEAKKTFLNVQSDFERGLIDEAAVWQEQELLEELETNIQNAESMREIKYDRIVEYENNITPN